MISEEGIKPDGKKMEAIKSLHVPTCVREFRSFIGMCSYYRRFIPNFSQLAEPNHSLDKKICSHIIHIHIKEPLSLSSIYLFSYFPFGFEGRIWDLIVSVPDHCLSFYFEYLIVKQLSHF